MAADNTTRRRVKLYMLNNSRVWDDQGTGHVSSAYVEKFKGMSLRVLSETDGSLLLESEIRPHTAYQKQQDTLIVWSEQDHYDFALSFQDKAGCDEIWEKICQVQGKDPSVEITQDIVEPESEEMEDDRFEEIPDTAPPIELPPCELSKLEEISELFNSVLLSPIRREKLSLAIRNEGYIKKLLDVFHMCEDLDNTEGLHHLYDIFKSVFLLNETMLFEIMFEEDCIFDVIGVLEYDPSQPQPAKHRHYLRTKAHFKQVIPLNNRALVQKIHQIYRVQYIQDVILPTPSVFEENMLSTLTSFIYFGKVEIVTMLQQDEKFLQTLFARLKDDEVDDEKRRDLVLFLKEFCTFSQTMQPHNRETFFNTLSNLGVLSAIEIILGLDDDVMKSAAIDIFSYIVEFSPSMVREYLLNEAQKQDDEDLLINLVIGQMVTDSDPELGGAVQLSGIIRLLIDPENMMGTTNKTEKSEFLGFFYKHCMHVLTAPLFANTVEDKPSRDDFQTSQLLSLIIELLTFCIEHHTYHVKNYIMTKDLVRRILVLLYSKHAFLALAALRLLRRTVGLKDEFYNRYLVKGNLFDPVVKAFINNGHKYNLFNSAVIELFEFIRTEDVKSLTSHIVERHFKDFEDITYVKTFKNLKQRYDQQQDRLKDKQPSLDSMPAILRGGGGAGPGSRFRRDPRSLDEEEEMYFDQEEEFDEADPVGASTETASPVHMPISDMIKNKLDSDLDQITRFLERSKSPVKDPDFRESPPRLLNRTSSPININLNASKSPPTSPCPTPASSPNKASGNSSSSSSSPARPASPGSNNGPSSPSSSSSSNLSPAQPLSPNSSSPAALRVSNGASSPPLGGDLADKTATKKPGLVGLVDYPDEDSEEEEEEESDAPPSAKRQRLSS